MSHHIGHGKFELFILSILNSKSKKLLVILLTLFALGASIMMLPTKLVKAKMLPGKSANTFTIHIDTPTGSSMEQTKEVSTCVTNLLQQENEITDMEVFLGSGSPLDYAGLVKGSGMKQGEEFAEIVVNLTDKNNRDEKSFSMVQRLRPIINNGCSNIIPNSSIKFVEMPAGPPTMADIVIEVYSSNENEIREISNNVKTILSQT
jgi:multidrug efflux pump subunit AcrB